jgi:hypothetical protein
MVKVHFCGLTEESTKETIEMILKRALAKFNGQTGEYIKGSGKRVFKMDMGDGEIKRECGNKGCGPMVNPIIEDFATYVK